MILSARSCMEVQDWRWLCICILYVTLSRQVIYCNLAKTNSERDVCAYLHDSNNRNINNLISEMGLWCVWMKGINWVCDFLTMGDAKDKLQFFFFFFLLLAFLKSLIYHNFSVVVAACFLSVLSAFLSIEIH